MNDSPPSRPNASKLVDLGPEVVRCRRLSGGRTLRAQGFLFGRLLYYVLFPLLILPYLAFMATMLLFFLLGHSIETMMGLPYGIVFAVLWLLLCGLNHLWPLRDYFVLHEKGIRIRVGFIFSGNHATTRGRVRHSANSFPPLAECLGSFKPFPYLYFRLCPERVRQPATLPPWSHPGQHTYQARLFFCPRM